MNKLLLLLITITITAMTTFCKAHLLGAARSRSCTYAYAAHASTTSTSVSASTSASTSSAHAHSHSHSTALTAVRDGTFFESIGRPRFISAPMVDQSSLPWRMFVRQHGTDLAFAQMMHARNFKNDKKYRGECVDWDNYRHVSGDPGMEAQGKTWDSPLIVQLAGDCPETLVAAGQYVHKDVTAVDLNCGCPQRIAKRGNYGAYLLPQTDLLISCLSALVKNLDCPVTVKIRVLPTERETLDLVRRIEDTGVSMLTVHGRLVSQSKLFTGPANWDIIRKIKDTLTIPVVANGGIGCYADALECLRITGADAVMSSEALLENPKLFSESGDEAFRLEFCRAQIGTVKEFVALVDAYPHPRPLNQVMRGHLFKMLFRFLQADANRDLQKLLSEGSYRQMVGVVALLEERLRGVDFDTERAVERGLCTPAGTGYYMRHRDERAQKRVLSLPRDRTSGNNGNVGTIGMGMGSEGCVGSMGSVDQRLRLEALRERRRDREQAGATVGEGAGVGAGEGAVSDAAIDGTVRKWLHKWILGLALCPWAVGVMGDEALRIAVVRGEGGQVGGQVGRMRQAFVDEAKLLINSDELQTTLVVLPGLVDFEDFLALVASLERTLERRGLDGQIQLASFHPQYQFAGTQPDDVSNYTNRSPYAVVHLLRVPAVTEAIEQVGGDTRFVYLDNIKRLNSMGIEAARKLQADIYNEV